MAKSELGNGSSHRSNGESSKLEEFVALYLGRLNDGEELDRDQILADHPDFGEKILSDLDAFIDMTDEGANAPLGTLGDYTLRRQIGRGGMGVVYEAWQGSMDRVVALKVLPPGVAADNRAFHRFMREAKTAGQLNHRNVVAVYSTGVEEGTPWYSMEFVEGETLAQILAKLRDAEPGTDTPFGKKDDVAYFGNLARAFADVADGLQHAHSKSVTHRDIKPSNLILDGEGRLRILDFGLARLEGQESLTVSGDFVGTPLYMSPEQARRKKIPVDHRTDVYSLGATMYEALTGQPPFRGKDYADTLSQIIERDPVEPRMVSPRVPKDLETIVLKCLRKDSGDRYGTAEALGQDLRRFVRGDPIEARPVSRWDRACQRFWRHRRLAAAIGVVSVLGITGLVTATLLIADAYRTAAEERDARFRDLYVSDMRLAARDWEVGDLGRFVRRLERHRPKAGEPDSRGWEWYCLRSLAEAGLLATLQEGTGAISSIDWQPGGESLLSTSSNGTIRISDAAGGSIVSEFELPIAAAVVARDPEGRRIALVDETGALRVWDVRRSAELYSVAIETASPNRSIFCLDWNPAGTRLAVGTKRIDEDRPRGSIAIVDAANGDMERVLDLGDSRGVSGVDWSPNGELLAAALEVPGHVVMWNSTTWKEADRFIPFKGDWLTSLAWSPDGAQLAVSRNSGGQGETTIWSLMEGEARIVFTTGSSCLAWSPQGDRLVAGGWDGSVFVWDGTVAVEPPTRIRAHTNAVSALAWHADGRRLASASEDGTAKVWDTSRRDGGVIGKSSVWSSDGKLLATSTGDRTVEVRDSNTGDVLWTRQCEKTIKQLAFSPGEGRYLAAAARGDAVRVWEWRVDEEVHQLEGEHGGGLWCLVSWSSDGRLLATGGWDGVLRLWDSRTWKLRRTIAAHALTLGAAVWSPDGSRLATTSADFDLKIWDTTTWRVVHQLTRAALTRSTRWEATHHSALAWSPDGKRLATAVFKGRPSGFVVFDALSGQELVRGQGHAFGTWAVAWNPSGKRLATAGADGTVKIWNPLTGEELITLACQGDVISLDWHPDGWRLLAGGVIWDASRASNLQGR